MEDFTMGKKTEAMEKNTVHKSTMQKFNNTSDTLEIWWDSSPLVFESWKKARIKAKPVEERQAEEDLLDTYYISDRPKEQLFRGVTTNPPLSGAVVKDDPGFWREWAIEQKRKNPKAGDHELWWTTYKEIVKRGAEKYLGVFRESGFKHGYISGQVDPRDYQNEEAMTEQALELAGLVSNVMIKIPGTEQGVRILKFLTSRGIATNCTLAFTMPQFAAVAQAVKEGLEIAKKQGINLTHWRSVITHMSARFEELGDLDAEAERAGIELTEADKRWSSIAIFKKALQYMEEKGYPSKMLICSLRPGPTVNGKKELWHLEKLAGAHAVFTCPPKFITQADEYDAAEFDPDAWKEPVPEEVLDKLSTLKFFREGYDPKGMEPPQFNTHSCTVATAKSFSKATDEMERFVLESLMKFA
jgi:transaldolase